uniref:hypothetical protein orf163 n=1 Tax=Deltalsia parasitica TaxID=1424640 RepID=UPI0022FD886B|nr:hypothetical protein orf163 [Deltalsia parasitica]WAX02810.1 hypothetical protein orf163 [Deltalsia parasitica]
MCNNVLFFRLYLLIILVFLFIFSLLLSKQLFVLVFNNLKILFLFNNLKKQMYLNEDTYGSLFSLYVFRENLFLSIALSELMLELNNSLIDKDVLANFLAYSYYHNSFYSISEYYCLKILSVSPYNHKIIVNLSNMYSNLGYNTKANDLLMGASKLKLDNSLSK